MSDVITFFDNFKRQIAENTHVAMLAKIVKFDAITMKADLQPLQSRLPMLINTPVALQKAGDFFIRVPYEAGDLAIVVFSDFSLDGSSKERHRIDDAVMVGGIVLDELPAEHEDDLIIAKKDMSMKIVISEDAITIETEDKDINLSTQEGDINISSVDGNVNISGQDDSDSW